MSVYYSNNKPSDDPLLYRWHENFTFHDIWYDKVSFIVHPKEDLPAPILAFLERWREKIEEYKKTYREQYPVKLAKIEFIYEDTVYALFPPAVGATYETSFMSDAPYEVSWDSLFEEYEREIREDLAATLGVEHSRYSGCLD